MGSKGVADELDTAGIDHTDVGPDPLPDGFSFLMVDEVASSLPPELNAVVVGFDMNINYLKMAKASMVANRPGAIFLATNTDEQFPIRPGVVMPGTLSTAR